MKGLPGLKALRKRRGLTLEALARSLDVSSGHMWKVEAGHRGASLELLQRLCVRLGCSADELVRP